MVTKETPSELLRCSFSNKSQREVRKLIAGPNVYICDDCVDICLDIIAEDRAREARESRPDLPKPSEIKTFLDDCCCCEPSASLKPVTGH